MAAGEFYTRCASPSELWRTSFRRLADELTERRTGSCRATYVPPTARRKTRAACQRGVRKRPHAHPRPAHRSRKGSGIIRAVRPGRRKEMPTAMTNTDLTSATDMTKVISPAQHAMLDYGVAATFMAFGFSVLSRNRAAAGLAFANGLMVLGMSLMTKYPGGVFPVISFRGHRTSSRRRSPVLDRCCSVSQTRRRRSTSTDRRRAKRA
jgi:hypothetical protein